jgi:hypothetical protein
MELTRYIHLNPVRAGMVALPEEYIWSSYRSYIGLSPAPAWLRQEAILAYFGSSTQSAKQRYRSFVEDLLGTAYESPLKKTFGTAVLGTEGFVAMIAETQIASKGNSRGSVLQKSKKQIIATSLSRLIVAGDHHGAAVTH